MNSKTSLMTLDSQQVKSPCISTCTLKDGRCIGCNRTIEHIKNWRNYTDKQKLEVLKMISTPEGS